MKILLDECLPKDLKKSFKEFQVITVPEKGWAGIKNGELLKRAESEFDIFITADQNLAFQQKIDNLKITVIVLKAKTTRLADLTILVSEVKNLLSTNLDKKIYKIEKS